MWAVTGLTTVEAGEVATQALCKCSDIQKCMYFKQWGYIIIYVHIALFFFFYYKFVQYGFAQYTVITHVNSCAGQGITLHSFIYSFYRLSILEFQVQNTYMTHCSCGKQTNFMLMEPTDYMPLLLKQTIQHNCDGSTLHCVGTICRNLLI